MTEEFYDEIEETFVDKDIEAHKFIFQQVKNMVKDAKTSKLTNSAAVRRLENGQMVNDTIKLKDYDLKKYELPSDPNWIPDELKGETVKHWIHKTTDKSFQYIKLYAQIVAIRFEFFNKSATENSNERIQEAQKRYDDAPAPQKEAFLRALEQEKKSAQAQEKKREEDTPKYFEQVIYNHIFTPLQKKVVENMDSELDKEFEQVYPSPKKDESEKKK